MDAAEQGTVHLAFQPCEVPKVPAVHGGKAWYVMIVPQVFSIPVQCVVISVLQWWLKRPDPGALGLQVSAGAMQRRRAGLVEAD